MRDVRVLVLVAALASCGRGRTSAPPPARTSAPPAALRVSAPPVALARAWPSDLPPDFQAWGLPARAAAWQGAWVVDPERTPGYLQAIGVAASGDARIWNGREETHPHFSLDAPCLARFERTLPTAGKVAWVLSFTVTRGKLFAGQGDAGSREGRGAIACIQDRVVTLDATGRCTAWARGSTGWIAEPTQCGFTTADGAPVFTAIVGGERHVLQVRDDALLSDSVRLVAAQPDFAAARAVIDAATRSRHD